MIARHVAILYVAWTETVPPELFIFNETMFQMKPMTSFLFGNPEDVAAFQNFTHNIQAWGSGERRQTIEEELAKQVRELVQDKIGKLPTDKAESEGEQIPVLAPGTKTSR